jgi:dihydroorotate dehydrogenase (fumarate)
VTRAGVLAGEVESDMLEIVRQVCASVKIPVSVKLSPFHTSPANFALALEHAGAAGVVFFNRFYQPDFDLDEMEVVPQLRLSDPSELLLRLRWLAIVSPQVRLSLAASGGVHSSRTPSRPCLPGRTRCRSSRRSCATGRTFCRGSLTGSATGWASTGTRASTSFAGR